MNTITQLQHKFAKEIIQYGISEVVVRDGIVKVQSKERLPWELYASIEAELL